MTFEAVLPEHRLQVQFVDALDQHDDVVTEELQQRLVDLSVLARTEPPNFALTIAKVVSTFDRLW
ncbi:MAG: hypothetical protein O2888_04000 [Chloroflexi bacterium]|nr:hypothetical protein [Chloroflexota bacterium]